MCINRDAMEITVLFSPYGLLSLSLIINNSKQISNKRITQKTKGEKKCSSLIYFDIYVIRTFFTGSTVDLNDETILYENVYELCTLHMYKI